MGHIVSCEDVKLDPNKIKAMMEWPIRKTLNNLRGSLGLAMYCHKLSKNYGRLMSPLIALLNKDAFSWTQEATYSFEKKEAMCRTHVLATLDFTKTFIVEFEFLGHGIGVVLM